MLGRTNTGGGGGGGLNFQVVGGTTAPSNPKENMIWVNTRAEITSYIFSATEPEAPVYGMVWISTGVSSTVEFNALKKNGIQVYPISAKQYVSGAWVDVEAKSYQNGEWVDWMTLLYSIGMTDVFTTLGWKSSSAMVALAPTVTYADDGASITVVDKTGGRTGIAYFDAIDLTDISTVEADLVLTDIDVDQYAYSNGLFIWSSVEVSGYYPDEAVAKYQFTENTTQTASLDVSSLTGNYYIGFGLRRNGDCEIVVKQVRLLP